MDLGRRCGRQTVAVPAGRAMTATVRVTPTGGVPAAGPAAYEPAARQILGEAM